MMKQLLNAALAISAIAAGAWLAAGPSGAAETIPEPECRIEARNIGAEVQLTAIAHGRPISGIYEFVVTTSGRGGSSDIVQAGDFSIRDSRAVLGVASFNSSGQDRYSAVLTLVSSGGTTVCRDAS